MNKIKILNFSISGVKIHDVYPGPRGHYNLIFLVEQLAISSMMRASNLHIELDRGKAGLGFITRSV